ncbi:GNAT family N-acetyltransferase [Bacillus changyiensis]|uniref:GNAT family N-acetyltransferase n=1 Tax=Bacillus changyiensis TaxID=3004103 RepID=UPI0022E719F2|nr:GNAT family protein [Bacillus changyiensis]MDA1477961.1 GNAT family protein [Bacillus changyiensis]
METLHSNRLMLRKMQLEDAEILYHYWSDRDVTKYMNISPFQNTDQAKAMIQMINELSLEGKANRFSIVLTETNEVIGTCGFNMIDNENMRAEIGYDLGRSHWGKGFASEAVRTLIHHGFTKMGLNRIEAKVEPENAPSIKLLEHLSFQKEGLLREYEKAKGVLIDVYMFSLLKKDWINK